MFADLYSFKFIYVVKVIIETKSEQSVQMNIFFSFISEVIYS